MTIIILTTLSGSLGHGDLAGLYPAVFGGSTLCGVDNVNRLVGHYISLQHLAQESIGGQKFGPIRGHDTEPLETRTSPCKGACVGHLPAFSSLVLRDFRPMKLADPI